jgi:arginase family enzyme
MVAAVEETVSKMVDSNVASLGLGGDHLTSYPALKAHAKKHGPLSPIHFDAHADLVEAPHLFHGSDLDEEPDAYKTFSDKKDGCIKVVMKPHG